MATYAYKGCFTLTGMGGYIAKGVVGRTVAKLGDLSVTDCAIQCGDPSVIFFYTDGPSSSHCLCYPNVEFYPTTKYCNLNCETSGACFGGSCPATSGDYEPCNDQISLFVRQGSPTRTVPTVTPTIQPSTTHSPSSSATVKPVSSTAQLASNVPNASDGLLTSVQISQLTTLINGTAVVVTVSSTVTFGRPSGSPEPSPPGNQVPAAAWAGAVVGAAVLAALVTAALVTRRRRARAREKNVETSLELIVGPVLFPETNTDVDGAVEVFADGKGPTVEMEVFGKHAGDAEPPSYASITEGESGVKGVHRSAPDVKESKE